MEWENAFLILFFLWIIWEIFRWHYISSALAVNQMQFLQEYTNVFLSELETIVRSKNPSLAAFFLSFIFPTGSGSHLTAKDQEFLQTNLEQIASTGNTVLTADLQARIGVLAAALLQLSKQHDGYLVGRNLTDDSKSVILSNMKSGVKVYAMWQPSIVDLIMHGYRSSFEAKLRQHGFTSIEHEGIRIWQRLPDSKSTSPKGSPILFLHGIGSVMSFLPALSEHISKGRRIIFPMHPTLTYKWSLDFRKGSMMTTLQFTKSVTNWLVTEKVLSMDLIAWSFGGFMRNYFTAEWNSRRSALRQSGIPSFRKQILIEPMGMPIASIHASTFNLMPIASAYHRAQLVAPEGGKWTQWMILIYLRYHYHVRPLFTDPFFNSHSTSLDFRLGVDTLNSRDVLLLLSENDIVVPYSASLAYAKQNLPFVTVDVHKRGEHGSWPYERADKLVEYCQTWLK